MLTTVGRLRAASILLAAALLAAGFYALEADTPARAAARFIAAMDGGSFAALRAAAAPDNPAAAFTEASSQPLFRLWREDAAFREGVRRSLTDGTAVVRTRRFPRRYAARIKTGRAYLDSEPAGAALALGGLPPGDGRYAALLPGDYALAARLTAANGEVFTAETRLTVRGGETARLRLRFVHASLDLVNAGGTAAEILVRGRSLGTLAGGAETRLSPLRTDTTLTLRAGGGAEKTVRADAGAAVFSLDPCRAEVRNDYASPITVLRGGERYAEIPAGESAVLEAPCGSELTLRLGDDGGVAPCSLVCAHASEYLRPVFRLTAAARAAAERAVLAYASSCFEAFGGNRLAALRALPQTELSRYLAGAASARANGHTEGGALDMTFRAARASLRTQALSLAADGAPVLTGYFELAFSRVTAAGEQEDTTLCRVSLRGGGEWRVISDP